MKNTKITNIRAIAIISVVLGHSIILYSPYWNIYTTTNKVYIFEVLKDIINIFQMPLFFSLAGYLFYKTMQHNNSFIEFLKKKFKRLIIPFIATAFLWLIPIKCLINYPNYMNKSLVEILKLVFSLEDSGHLWYLPTLFLIFILMFFIVKCLLKNDRNYKYILLFIMLLFISLLSTKIQTNPYISYILANAIYFYLGFMISKYRIYLNKINKVIISIITLCLLIITLIYNNIYLTYITSFMIVLTLYKITSNKNNELISRISKNSFGIYLIHSPLIYITYTFFTNSNPILVVFINFVCFGMVAFLLTELLRKTPFKVFIGEG